MGASAQQLRGSAEENTLTILCWNDQHAAAVAKQVPPELFSTRAYREIAEKAIEHLQQFGVPPKAHLLNILEDKLRRGDEGILLKRTLDAMEELQAKLQPEYVLAELDKFITLRRMSMAVEKAADALDEGEIGTAAAAAAEVTAVHREFIKPQTLPSAAELLEKEMPKVQWIVPDYIPSGLTLIAGPPKIGKSWLVLNLALSCAGGLHQVFGNSVPKADVLLLSFEDNERRLQSRLHDIIGDQQVKLDNLLYEFEPHGRGGAFTAWLDKELDEYPGIRVVIIDTLQHIKAHQRQGQPIYEADVEAVRPLRAIAEKRCISIVVVHHTKKGKNDPLEAVSGSFGLTGSVDTIITLTRQGDEQPDEQEPDEDARERKIRKARIQGTGRDLIENFDKLIEFDDGRHVWQVVDDYYEATPEKRKTVRSDILAALKDGPMRADAIAAQIGKTPGTVKVELNRMLNKTPPLVTHFSHGLWVLPPSGIRRGPSLQAAA